MNITIRKATEDDIKDVVKFVDKNFTREGYGFVTSGQMATEIKRGSCYLAFDGDAIVGSRIGLNRIYNLAVKKEYRKTGIGRQLVEVHEPDLIRVKAEPVGNLSKAQLAGFKNPEGFYESLGYSLDSIDFARNFHQRGKAGEKAHFHKQGKVKHIKIYKKTEGKP